MIKTSVKSNVVLIGMPGCGKSTAGVLLAKRLGRYFLDTDVLIQAVEGRTLREIIAEKGMDGFCDVERTHVECVDIKNAVIATGGSVVYYPSAMRALKAEGVIVYLSLSLAELEKRLSDLGRRGVVIEPNQTLSTLYEKRIPLYEQWADVTVDLSGLNHEASVEEILKKTRGHDKPKL
ncbi:MAG: shikimate kinase [Planctomycetota bacterium]|nr:MAG: shikimate kinase [Planctomycetota bacterium]RKY10850.1 MAG: shikimate kinase [Planctomycetota bacterium]